MEHDQPSSDIHALYHEEILSLTILDRCMEIIQITKPDDNHQDYTMEDFFILAERLRLWIDAGQVTTSIEGTRQ